MQWIYHILMNELSHSTIQLLLCIPLSYSMTGSRTSPLSPPNLLEGWYLHTSLSLFCCGLMRAWLRSWQWQLPSIKAFVRFAPGGIWTASSHWNKCCPEKPSQLHTGLFTCRLHVCPLTSMQIHIQPCTCQTPCEYMIQHSAYMILHSNAYKTDHIHLITPFRRGGNLLVPHNSILGVTIW